MNEVLVGDAIEKLRELDDKSVQMCCTSPPYYGLRDYGMAGQIGLESTPAEYIEKVVAVFDEVWRVLRDDGTLWVNLGDTYATGGGAVGRCPGGGEQGERFLRQGMINTPPNRMPLDGFKPKDLMMIPARVAIDLQDAGWYLRSDIIWQKSNCMPESVKDRPTSAHEHIFLFAKSVKYWYDADAIAEPMSQEEATRRLRERREGQGAVYEIARNGASGKVFGSNSCITNKSARGEGAVDGFRNARNVWTIPSQPSTENHYASFPEELPRRCILAGCPIGGTVLDPFLGTGTVLAVAKQLGRKGIGIDLNPNYCEIARKRIANTPEPLIIVQPYIKHRRQDCPMETAEQETMFL